MNIRTPSRRRGLFVALALTAVLVPAVIAANQATGGPLPAEQPAGPPATLAPLTGASPPTEWPRNAEGLSYGSEADAVSLADCPDLIAVVATNGESGYVRRADVQLSPPTADQVKDAPSKIWSIPVYEVDGKTQVGVLRTGWAPASESVAASE